MEEKDGRDGYRRTRMAAGVCRPVAGGRRCRLAAGRGECSLPPGRGHGMPAAIVALHGWPRGYVALEERRGGEVEACRHGLGRGTAAVIVTLQQRPGVFRLGGTAGRGGDGRGNHRPAQQGYVALDKGRGEAGRGRTSLRTRGGEGGMRPAARTRPRSCRGDRRLTRMAAGVCRLGGVTGRGIEETRQQRRRMKEADEQANRRRMAGWRTGCGGLRR